MPAPQINHALTNYYLLLQLKASPVLRQEGLIDFSFLRTCKQNGASYYLDRLLVQFSIECGKTKTIVITLANHKEHRQSSEPIETRGNYM